MDEFDDHRELDVPARVVAQRAGGKQDEQRPQPFAPPADDVLGDLVHEDDVGLQARPDGAVDGREIGADERPDRSEIGERDRWCGGACELGRGHRRIGGGAGGFSRIISSRPGCAGRPEAGTAVRRKGAAAGLVRAPLSTVAPGVSSGPGGSGGKCRACRTVREGVVSRGVEKLESPVCGGRPPHLRSERHNVCGDRDGRQAVSGQGRRQPAGGAASMRRKAPRSSSIGSFSSATASGSPSAGRSSRTAGWPRPSRPTAGRRRSRW